MFSHYISRPCSEFHAGRGRWPLLFQFPQSFQLARSSKRTEPCAVPEGKQTQTKTRENKKTVIWLHDILCKYICTRLPANSTHAAWLHALSSRGNVPYNKNTLHAKFYLCDFQHRLLVKLCSRIFLRASCNVPEVSQLLEQEHLNYICAWMRNKATHPLASRNTIAIPALFVL
jgi:hypothetical protein